MVAPVNPAAPGSVSQPAVSPSGASTAGRSSATPPVDPPADQSVRAQIKRQGDAAILQASQQVSLQSGNEPLALLYTAAIDAINDKLAPSLGDNALQRGLDEGLDVSPQATAERIVSLTTALFGRYQASNPQLAFSDQVERFVGIIAEGIDQGFGEARDILGGLGVLEGDIATNIDTTYDWVQQGLQAFMDQRLAVSEASVANPPEV